MKPAKKVMGHKLLFACLFVTVFYSCKKHDHPARQGINLQMIADGMVSPLSVTEAPDASGRLFVVDQPGQVWIIDKAGNKLPTAFLDLSAKIVTLSPGYDERGLLSLAFHPDYKTNGKFYVFYTAPPRSGGPEAGVNWNNLTRISEFHVSAAANVADAASERILLEEDHPQLNHNGGSIAFGPDGYLYIAIGDGGNKDDVGPGHVEDWYPGNTGGNGQDIFQNLMGSILRIDINSGATYSVPGDNPFTGTEAKTEVWAYGFRNPYRFSFDMGGEHSLIVGDAGQALYEEIDLVHKGGNYGWNVKEGTHCFSTAADTVELGSCPMTDSLGNALIDPVLEMKNFANPAGGGIATVIVGGNVYRGNKIRGLDGKYIFGIFSQNGEPNAKIYSASMSNTGSWPFDAIALRDFSPDIGQYLKGFGQDNQGEIYLTTSMEAGLNGSTGKVFKLVAVD